jgi:hypothetical protein
MSRNTPVTKKPYCKVCFDAGKPESEYTSHWVRSLPDRNGKTTVICPTLLNTECRYCYQSGHTAKFCPAIKQQDKERERAKKVEAAQKTKPKVQEKKNTSAFAGLMDESDSEEEVMVSKPVENYPMLNTPVKKIEVEKQEVKTGWAAIVAKPAEVKKVVEPTKPTGLVMLSDYIKCEAKIEEKKVEQAKTAPWAKKQPVVTKSWADASDSEDECEFDDDYDPYKPYSFAVAEDDETW